MSIAAHGLPVGVQIRAEFVELGFDERKPAALFAIAFQRVLKEADSGRGKDVG